MRPTPEQCARQVLETVPVVMRFIHSHIRRRRMGGLSLAQFRALAFLDRFKDPSLSAVAGHLGLSLPAMSRLMDSLVEQGLVQRRTGASDRRQVALAPTAGGLRLLETARAEIRRQLAATLEKLSAGERAALRDALRGLHRVFDSWSLPVKRKPERPPSPFPSPRNRRTSGSR